MSVAAFLYETYDTAWPKSAYVGSWCDERTILETLRGERFGNLATFDHDTYAWKEYRWNYQYIHCTKPQYGKWDDAETKHYIKDRWGSYGKDKLEGWTEFEVNKKYMREDVKLGDLDPRFLVGYWSNADQYNWDDLYEDNIRDSMEFK